MYRPLAPAVATSDDPAVALTRPNGVGDAAIVYLIITAPTAACALTSVGADATSGLDVGIGETWIAGPILGADIENWALFSAAEQLDQIVMALVGKPQVDPRGAPRSVDDGRPIATALEFTWRQLV